MPTIALSESALNLLRRHSLEDGIKPTEDSRPLYRELVAEGLMRPVHSFRDGRDSFFVPTEIGRKLADVLGRM